MRILSLIFLINNAVFASTPTTEGLFRNPNNEEVGASLINAKFMLEKKMSPELMMTTAKEVTDEQEQSIATKTDMLYVDFWIGLDTNERVQIIQGIYLNANMENDSLVDIRFISNLNQKINIDNKKKSLFYSLLSSLILNRSEEMSRFLKLSSQTYKKNSELINSEKKALYDKYKEYLKMIKEDASLKETMDNPLEPSDPEVANVIKQVLEQPLMFKDPHVTLVKDNKDFFWRVKHDVFGAEFENETLRIEKFLYSNKEDKVHVSFDDYILFDGTHELPKIIKMNTKEKSYHIKSLSLKHYHVSNPKMSTRYQKYSKRLDQDVAKNTVLDIFLVK